ncbi:putative CONSERVED INTEGRAL MEMBRANE PROTEIN [Pseudonocardia sp. Ae168_Ps1]|nr:putative CONSERVED INTEGRAL MEMBRANE PROTEIN [Pseudonocardia sp. Ae150A_Ps1]OLL82445.1 putative CONSERVED INTEGRAL MEMBRANE PROTEIN [Pseudonocardia sp. Ae168_Ps1]OLL83440.1 putative CONSERVED INTEGRAL MEMBRANE PROTEIN [Pseudonocardia sp. Ae263_Ps1]OLL90520.1 putative CONSERVED INTEGRAL MEMBRANE PROTEIN [Pseudonocardia sp. Ae356_Ps1]
MMLRLILNVIWLVLSGFWLFLGYLAAGIVACVLIVTIPFGIAAFRIGFYALWPFGRDVVRRPTAGVASTIGNVLWILLFGWWLVLGHIGTAIALAITIVGLPLAWANLKLIPVSLFPLGSQVVDTDD